MFKNVTLTLFSVHLPSRDHLRFGHRHPRPWKCPSRRLGKPYRICLPEGGNVSECNPYFLHDATNSSFTSRPQTLEQAGAPFSSSWHFYQRRGSRKITPTTRILHDASNCSFPLQPQTPPRTGPLSCLRVTYINGESQEK